MDEQMEQAKDFKSLREQFQNNAAGAQPSNNSNFVPKKPDVPKINNIRSNPAIRTVIDTLEDRRTAPVQAVKKPKVPLKPKVTSVAGPKVAHKGQTRKADLEDPSMKLSKPFRHTLSITDPSRRDGDGMCSNSLQLYNRRSLSSDVETGFACSSPEKQMPPDECYETVGPRPPIMIEKGHLLGNSSPPPLPVVFGPPILPPNEHFKCIANSIGKELLSMPRHNSQFTNDASLVFPSVVNQDEGEDLYVTSDQFVVLQEEQLHPVSSCESSPTSVSDSSLPFESKLDSNDTGRSGRNLDYSPCGERRKSALPPPEMERNGLNNVPKLKPLPLCNLLGPPPTKLPRPPMVDLQKFIKEAQEEKNIILESEEMDGQSDTPPAPGADEYYEEPLRQLVETIESFCEVEDDTLDDSDGRHGSSYEVADDHNQPSYKNLHHEGNFITGTEPAAFPVHPKCDKIGKHEEALRKKFQISGFEKAMYKMSVKENCKGGKDMLSLAKGELVEIIQVTDCPTGKWLARNDNGNYGFIPVSVIDAYQDILAYSNTYLRQNVPRPDVYMEVGSGETMGDDSFTASSNDSEDLDNVYDDATSNKSTVSNSSGGRAKTFFQKILKETKKKDDSGFISPTFLNDLPQTNELYSTDINENQKGDAKKLNWRQIFHKPKEPKTDNIESDRKMDKKFAKEEKIFREKFKYTSEIVASNTAIVNEFAPVSPKSKLALPVKPGEKLDVIDVSSENLIICRNSQGKFGHVLIECLNFESREYKQ